MTIQWVKKTAERAGILLLTAVLVCLSLNVKAQAPERITLSHSRMRISELFREIERQTGSVMVVRSGTLDDSRVITLPGASGSLDEILGTVLAGSGKGYRVSDGYIIIGTPRVEPATAALRAASAPATTHEPIIIRKDELRKFVPDKAEPAVIQPLGDGIMRFEADDKLFYTPGKLSTGEVAAPFTTAERWQRSKFALKTNLLYGFGTLTPNLRAEVGLGYRTSLEGGLAYNGTNLNGTVENNKKLVHGVALGEFRYWLCERFDGHFFGAHAFGGFYNVGGRDIPLLFEKEYRYEGTAYGAGVSYGYMLALSPRWAVEFNVGVGVAQMKYNKYGCEKCDELIDTFDKTYFGPTRAAINLVFIIK